MIINNLMFEGCDCVGKTTLINYFINKNKNYKLIKCNNPKNYEDGLDQYLAIRKKLKIHNNIILDRGLLGECVYAPIFRDYYPDYMRDLETEIKNDLILILLVADIEIIKKRFDGKFIKPEQIALIQNKFLNEFDKSNYKNKIILDTSNKKPEDLYDELITRLNFIQWTN